MNEILVKLVSKSHWICSLNAIGRRSVSTTAVLAGGHRVNVKKFMRWDMKRRRLNTDEFPDEYTNRRREARPVSFADSVLPSELSKLRFQYPEFLPPNDPSKRHKIAQLLERQDMLNRRANVDIPEFYVGSIVAVTVSDPYAPGKVSRFLGICINREGQGLRANFTLRNVIDGEGVEIRYEMYNPTIRDVEVVKLEKRLDDQLYYLRDALPEFSTFPLDMEPVIHNKGDPVPINPLRVIMKPHPWTKRWEVVYPKIRGIDKLEGVPDILYNRSRKSHNKYEKFDLMKEYREHITEEDQLELWESVHEPIEKLEDIRRAERRKKVLEST